MTNPNQRVMQQRGLPAGAQFQQSNPFFGLLPREFTRRLKDTFTYSVRFNTIAASGTATQSVNIQNDSDFVWTIGAMVVTSADFTTFVDPQDVPMLVTIKDAASGRDLSNSEVHISNYFGTAQNPFVLSMPKIFRAGGQVTVTLQNQSATARVVNLAFHGFKVFFMDAQ